jgi:hypothetical protein
LCILCQRGFSDVANLTGGYVSILGEGGFEVEVA